VVHIQEKKLQENEKQERERKRKFDSQENLIKAREQLELAEIVEKQVNPPAGPPAKKGFSAALKSVFSRG